MIRNRLLALVAAAGIAMAGMPALALPRAQPKPAIRSASPILKRTQSTKKPSRAAAGFIPRKTAAKAPSKKLIAKKVAVKKVASRKTTARPAKKAASTPRPLPMLRGVPATTLRSGPVSLPKPRSTIARALRGAR